MNASLGNTRHLFLIGFMGVGKTTNGKKLAALLNYPFVDLDEVFVEQEGMPISDFFALHGEAAFREKEREILRAVVNRPTSVISTGGGAPCYFDNMDWMNQQGTTIYLTMPHTALANRLANSKRHKRPLIKDLSEEEILQLIEERMQQREPFYSQAQHHIPALDLDLEELAKNLGLKE
ncbi:shikimate kinase [Olivibacter sitiensis]|uniref:shikimate kinase n=1 Tax=Olivibacter sitiensis TaxID=376470 RepID=UPI000407EF0C|nr:shikimate kinase [Olivibacter sitiensis]